MEQPKLQNTEARENWNRKPPSPKELIALYESKGMEPQEAAVKVIEDLQGLLFRVARARNGKKERFMAETPRKLDNALTRLAIIENKLDSKPGIGRTFAIGVAAGAALNGLGRLWASVARSTGEIWGAVGSVTKSSPAS
uniref:Uncharacterized protein n=1 Tax=Kalanchoe fedtschenkoi TaxID=63787 RepID=A0A7N0TW55_KALFE